MNTNISHLLVVYCRGFCFCLLILSMSLNLAQWTGLLVNKDNLTIVVPKQQQVASVQPVYSELEDEALINAVTNRTR